MHKGKAKGKFAPML